MLAGPAFVVMLLVTAYPILQAVWYSLFNYRLTDPDNRAFRGLGNYGVILTDPLWWQAVLRDRVHHGRDRGGRARSWASAWPW